MTKTQISNEIRLSWNTTRQIKNIKIATVGWREYCYMIIRPNDNFATISDDDYKPLEACIYKKDFINLIYKIINKE